MSMIRGKKGGKGGSSHTHYEAPNNLKSVSTAKALDLISEGEIVGLVDGAKSIYLDDVPLQNADGTYNFNGVSVAMRNGLPDQEFLPGFSSVEAFVQVGREVKYNLPITHRVQDDNLDAIILTMEFPNLSQQNTKNGDMLQYSVQFQVRIRADEGVWQDSGVITVAGKCISSFQRSYYFKVPQSQEGIYDIQVIRVSPDDEVSSKHSITNWYGFSRVIEAKLNYPNRAVCGLTVRADQFGSNVPSRKYEVYGLIVQVPSNYDAWKHTYTTEVWDGTFKRSWTNNPAWIFYDLVTNGRYGLGRDIKPEYIDKYGLYMIGRYCDEMVSDGKGGKEPRFTFNGTISNRESAYSVLNNLAGLFNSMIYYSGSIITLVQDSPKLPVRDFTPANVVDGYFNYEGVARSARHSVFQVTYSEPDDLYSSAIEVVENPEMIQDIGWKSSEITLVGCTSRGQARRRALRDVYTEQHETETVTFGVGIENADLVPGDIIRVADPSYAGARYGGRIIAIDQKTNTVTLDAETDFTISNDWMFGFLLPDNTWIEIPVIACGVSDRIVLARSLDTYPEVGTVWTAQCAEVEPRLFRVLSIKEDKPWQYTITALLHYDQKYDVIENGVSFTEGSFSTIPSGALKAPVNLAAEQYLHRVGDSILISIVISWNSGDPRSMNYLVRYKQTGDEVWTDAGYTATESLVLNDTTEDTYTIQVQAIDALGRRSTYAEILYQAPGYKITTANVTNLRYSLSQIFGVIWEWDECDALDFHQFIISVNNDKVEYPTKNTLHYTTPYKFTGTLQASVLIENLGGVRSKVPAIASVEISPPSKPNAVYEIQKSGATISWKDCKTTWDIQYYVVEDPYLGTISEYKDRMFSISPRPAGKQYNFFIHAVDIFGNVSETAEVPVIIDVIPAPTPTVIDEDGNAVVTIDGTQAVISWNTVEAPFTVDIYEVMTQEGLYLGKVKGTEFRFEAPLCGIYGYKVRAIDIAGNVGAFCEYVLKLGAPEKPEVVAILGEDQSSIALSWTMPSSSVPVVSFDVIRQWDELRTDEVLETLEEDYGRYDVQAINLPALPVGKYTFLVRAVDSSGNTGMWGTIDFEVHAPGAVTPYDCRAVYNNVMLYFTEPSFTMFKVREYLIQEIDDSEYPAEIGTVDALFFAEVRNSAGMYTYGIIPVDIAGNRGPIARVTVKVDSPPNLVLFHEWESTFNGEKTNLILDGHGSMIGPVSSEESWNENISRSASALGISSSALTWEAKDAGGLKTWLEPATAQAVYVEVKDIAELLSAPTIDVTVTQMTLSGKPSMTCKIEVSENGDAWRVAAENATNITTENVRFVRITLTWIGGLVQVQNMYVSMNVKTVEDSGTVMCRAADCLASDGSFLPDEKFGTRVDFNVQFIDVENEIEVKTTSNDSGLNPLVVFSEGAHSYPTGFRVALLNSSGRPVDGEVFWYAKGR